MDYIDGISEDSRPRRARPHTASRQRRNADSLANVNLEDQNEEVLRWLKEEMERSQTLINRSKQLHDAELVSAKKEVEKVKRAARLLIKAAKKKGKGAAPMHNHAPGEVGVLCKLCETHGDVMSQGPFGPWKSEMEYVSDTLCIIKNT